jgi:hypothetical protein
VITSLLADKRVDRPAAIQPELDPVVLQQPD